LRALAGLAGADFGKLAVIFSAFDCFLFFCAFDTAIAAVSMLTGIKAVSVRIFIIRYLII
jgi:hypothetical protein